MQMQLAIVTGDERDEQRQVVRRGPCTSAPVEGVGHEEVLPEHEEDGGQDGGDDGAPHALALAVPLAVKAVARRVVATDRHRHLRHHACSTRTMLSL